MAINISNASASLGANAVGDQLDNGYLRIYNGAQPATVDTALSGNTLLAELRFNVTAFGAAVNGVKTANALTADASANNAGTASFFRTFKADGATVVYDGTVGVSAADLILNSLAISAGAEVYVTSLSLTLPKA